MNHTQTLTFNFLDGIIKILYNTLEEEKKQFNNILKYPILQRAEHRIYQFLHNIEHTPIYRYKKKELKKFLKLILLLKNLNFNNFNFQNMNKNQLKNSIYGLIGHYNNNKPLYKKLYIIINYYDRLVYNNEFKEFMEKYDDVFEYYDVDELKRAVYNAAVSHSIGFIKLNVNCFNDIIRASLYYNNNNDDNVIRYLYIY